MHYISCVSFGSEEKKSCFYFLYRRFELRTSVPLYSGHVYILRLHCRVSKIITLLSYTEPNKDCFTFCWPCIMLLFLVNDQRDAQFSSMYLFLTLYMFRAHHAHHKERQFVSIQPLVTVTLC
jgi:hypothetical protein